MFTRKTTSDMEAGQPAPSLLGELLSAWGGGDSRGFDRLCRVHVPAILGAFAGWLSPPASLAAGSAEYHRYFDGLYGVSKHLQDALGVGGLFAQLVAPGRENPFAVWEAKINRSLDLSKRMEWEQAYQLLSDHLIDCRDLGGFGYAHMAATTHWYCSQYRSNARDRAVTIGHAERSLAITRRIGDHPKYLLRYLKHLWAVHRYFGEPAAATVYARELADGFAKADAPADATFYRRQAELLDRGEPLTRVAARVGRAEYELADLPLVRQGTVELHVVRNRMTLLASLLMVREAQSSLARGEGIEALDWLRRAAAADPYDPEPQRLRGSWLLAGGSFAAAAQAFADSERLAPGWPQCRTGLWFAERLAVGQLEPDAAGVWFAPAQAEPEQRLDELRARVRRYDRLALPHLNLAEALRAAGRSAEAERALRDGLERDGDEATRTCLLVGLATLTQDVAERRSLAASAAEMNGDLVAAAAASLVLNAPA